MATNHKYSENKVVIKLCKDSKSVIQILITLTVHELHDSRNYVNHVTHEPKVSFQFFKNCFRI